MSSSEEEGTSKSPVQEPSDRWLGAKGPGHINVGVQYTIRPDGGISSKWDVDATHALPSKLPMFMYRSAHSPALKPFQTAHCRAIWASQEGCLCTLVQLRSSMTLQTLASSPTKVA